MSTLEIIAVTQPSSLVIRWIHFVALAIALGGAVVLAFADEIPAELAYRYELLFWTALGLLVVTGIGNVGALAPSVPGYDTTWGRLFTLKLVAVLLLIGMSVLRTGSVSQRAPQHAPHRNWYVFTAGWIAIIGAFAVVMVRG